jgi:hypothetical protein
MSKEREMRIKILKDMIQKGEIKIKHLEEMIKDINHQVDFLTMDCKILTDLVARVERQEK